MRIVINTESERPELIGEFVRYEQDAVIAREGTTTLRYCPSDCVALIEVDVSHLPNWVPDEETLRIVGNVLDEAYRLGAPDEIIQEGIVGEESGREDSPT